MAVNDRVRCLTYDAIDATSVTGSFKPINAGGLLYPCFLLRLVNNSNIDVTISYDGVADNDILPAGKELNLPSQGNSQPNNFRALFATGTVIYASGDGSGMGVTGRIYVTGYYQV